jgi:hypothetical protein
MCTRTTWESHHWGEESCNLYHKNLAPHKILMCKISSVRFSSLLCASSWGKLLDPLKKKLICSMWLPLNKALPWVGQTQGCWQWRPPRNSWPL